MAHLGRHWSGIGLTPLDAEDQEWRQEVARSYPGILAGVSAFTPIAGAVNETLRAYLNDQYGLTQTDLVPLVDRYLDADTLADKTVSLRELKVTTDVENR